jgi:protein involved in polysaccharide export with SLBB domain
MQIKHKYPLLIVLLLILCSCSSTGQKKSVQSIYTTIPKGTAEIHNSKRSIDEITDKSQPDYRIQNRDKLYITVYNEPELSFDQSRNRSLRVSTDGKISFPLLGEIMVAGLTPFQLEKKLEKLLGDGYLIDPYVFVTIKSYHGLVYVIGEVRKPGEIILQGKGMTAVEAISMSGGFADFASPNRTYIVRVENGERKIISAKISRILKNKDKDIILKPGDIVVIPETFF